MATTDKYDRQLRLWGASGQRALGSTMVALLGSSACGTETLKNLVLPGVGSFLVVDDGDEVSPSEAATQEVQKCPDLHPSLLQFGEHSSNFFLPPPSKVGGDDDGSKKNLSKAAMACALLSELNPDVLGFHYTVPSLEGLDYSALLEKIKQAPPSSSSNGSSATASSSPQKILVIAADQPSTVTLPLSYECHKRCIPLLVVRAYGLLGYARIQTASPYHCIIEAKKSSRIPDLRLSAWPIFEGLKNVVATVKNLDEMDDTKDHSHVPFVLILLQALEKWRGTVSAPFNPDPALRPRYPETFQEKEDFRKLVKGMAKNLNNEINFEEAIREAHLTWVDGRVSDEVKEVLDKVDEKDFFASAIKSEMDVEDSAMPSVPAHVLQFQLLVLSLKRFLKKNDDYPPLEGKIPDMTSDTTRYVALQEAYQKQAEQDRATMCEIAKTLLDECKQNSNGCDLLVSMPSDDDIVTFCKNARYLRILETRPLYAEYRVQDPASPTLSILNPSSFENISNFDNIQADARDDLQSATFDPYETDPIQTPLLWWIALRACDAFYDRHEHYPGKHDQELALESDANEVYKFMTQITSNLGLSECDFIKANLLDSAKGKDLAREVVRYDEAEIHNVAAVIGGVASQEAVKLITGQYVPFDDTYVYNGISSTAGVYKF
jgi:amyloid beta precursor protein binding protein 1